MDDVITVVESRTPEGLGFHLKVRSTGKLFRVMPARWPPQPRYWCLCVYRCKPSGTADPAELPWIGSSGMTREELPAATQAIRENVNAWLAQEALQDLRAWLLVEDASATDRKGSSFRAGESPSGHAPEAAL